MKVSTLSIETYFESDGTKHYIVAYGTSFSGQLTREKSSWQIFLVASAIQPAEIFLMVIRLRPVIWEKSIDVKNLIILNISPSSDDSNAGSSLTWCQLVLHKGPSI